MLNQFISQARENDWDLEATQATVEQFQEWGE